MAWGAVAGAAGGVISSLIGALGGSAMEYKYAKRLQKRSFGFQERMSSTAYQRAMADMRKAGLNPILAYQQGGAGGGAGGIPRTPNVDLSRTVSSAVAGARLGQELKNLRADEYARTKQGQMWREEKFLAMEAQHESIERQRNLVLQRRLMQAGLPTARQLEAWTKSESGQRWNRWKFARERALGGGTPAGWVSPVLRSIGR